MIGENLVKDYFLNPGELIFSKKPIVVKTVLGSCVAVCIHDKNLKFGGMCHYLLPVDPSTSNKSTKYGDVAIYTLINKFIQNDSKKEDLIAAIIGGAFVVFDEKEIFFIGDRNVEIAYNILRKENIQIKQMYTGGDHGRKVFFSTATNKIIVENLLDITIDSLYNPNI